MSKITHEEGRKSLLKLGNYLATIFENCPNELVDLEDYINQQEKQDKLLELYKELSNQKSNLYSYDEQYRQYSYNRDVQVIVRYIETQIKELENDTRTSIKT